MLLMDLSMTAKLNLKYNKSGSISPTSFVKQFSDSFFLSFFGLGLGLGMRPIISDIPVGIFPPLAEATTASAAPHFSFKTNYSSFLSDGLN